MSSKASAQDLAFASPARSLPDQPLADQPDPQRPRPGTGADAHLDRLLRARSEGLGVSARDESALLDEVARWLSEPIRFSPVAAFWLPDVREAASDDASDLAPPSFENVVVRFEGFDRVAATEARRFFRRAYRNELQRIFLEEVGPDRRWLDDFFAARDLERRSAADVVTFAARFPDYWMGRRGGVREPEVVTYGERIELLEVLGYSFGNDLRVRRGPSGRPGASSQARAARSAAAITPPSLLTHPPGVTRRTVEPRGNVVAGSWYSLDAQARARFSRFQPRLCGYAEARLYDDRHDEELCAVQLTVEVEPMDGDFAVAIEIELRSF